MKPSFFTHSPRQRLRWSAAAGALAWIASWAAPVASTDRLDVLLERLILLGPLVAVPLGLALAATPRRDGGHAAVYRALSWAQPVAAGLSLASIFVEKGPMSAALTFPWLVVTGMIAGYGLWRLLPRGRDPVGELAVDVGMLYLPIGGVWWMSSRASFALMDFPLLIVTLTAAHFHFAGFCAPLITGLSGRSERLHGGIWGGLYRFAAWSVIVNPILIALGITISPLVEVICAFGLALALLVMSVLMVARVAPGLKHPLAWLLVTISGLSLVATMALACAYALGEFTGRAWVQIPYMAQTHGVINVVGFALCGLLGLSLAELPPRGRAPWPPFSRLFAAGRRVGPDFFARERLEEAADPPPTGLVDDLSAYERPRFPVAAVHPAVRTFYEHTARQRLYVRPRWSPGFVWGGRLYRRLAGLVDQMGLPVEDTRDDQMESRILKVRDDADGRDRVRAWVRTYASTGQVVYVAAYSLHRHEGVPYMNIAFPLPGANVTSLLRMDQVSAGPGAEGGLVLSTLPEEGRVGDEGIYLVTRWLPVRTPLDEAITVWATPPGEDERGWPAGAQGSQVLARHDMWLFGVHFLRLEYYLLDEAG